jgi:hypothetical protein
MLKTINDLNFENFRKLYNLTEERDNNTFNRVLAFFKEVNNNKHFISMIPSIATLNENDCPANKESIVAYQKQL